MNEARSRGWRGLLERHGLLLALGLAALLCSPALLGRLFADDYYHLISVEHPGAVGPNRGTWDLFTFATGEPARVTPFITKGPYPWWTLPTVRLSLFRPLSSELTHLDYVLFGRWLPAHHLHSILWYLALVGVACALYRRTLGGQGRLALLAPLAMVLFAIDDVHWLAAVWLANRNALVATAPVLLGLLFHLRWREDGWRAGLFLSVPCYAIGLAGGETALGALAYLGAYEVFAGPGGWRGRALALAPAAVLGAGYLAVYRWMHAGASDSGIYIDPLVSPGAYLANAPGRALALIGTQLLATPSDAWLLLQPLRPVLVVAGVLGIALLVFLLRRVWPELPEPTRRHLRWWLAGSVFSLLPVMATFPLNRLLLMPSLGAAAVVAAVLLHPGGGRWVRAGVWVLFFCNVVEAPVGWAASYVIGVSAMRGQEHTGAQVGVSDAEMTRKVVLFAAPDAMVGLYPPLVRVWEGKPLPEAWLCFSYAPYPHRLTRVASDTLELEVLGGHMLETVFEQLIRSPDHPVNLGDRVQLDGVEVTVMGLDQGRPQRLRLRFTEPIDGGGYTFLQWKGGRLDRLELPPVGQSVELQWTPGDLSF